VHSLQRVRGQRPDHGTGCLFISPAFVNQSAGFPACQPPGFSGASTQSAPATTGCTRHVSPDLFYIGDVNPFASDLQVLLDGGLQGFGCQPVGARLRLGCARRCTTFMFRNGFWMGNELCSATNLQILLDGSLQGFRRQRPICARLGSQHPAVRHARDHARLLQARVRLRSHEI